MTSLQRYSVAGPGVEMTGAPALSGSAVTSATADTTTAGHTATLSAGAVVLR